MVRVFSCRCNVALSRSISRIERRNIRWFSRRISEGHYEYRKGKYTQGDWGRTPWSFLLAPQPERHCSPSDVRLLLESDSFTEVRREKSLRFSLLSDFIGPVLVRFPDNVRMRAAV